MKQLFTLLIILFLFTPPLHSSNQLAFKSLGRVILTGTTDFYEELCHQEINKVRQEYALKLLEWWPKLADCAREHSQNMAEGIIPTGHDGFGQRYKKMKKKDRLYNFGENVAYCYNYPDPVQVAVEGWMNSDGHRKNILKTEYLETGIGVAISEEGKFYITQLFARRR